MRLHFTKKIGDKKNAKAFLGGLIKKYPGTKAAKIAKKVKKW